MSTIISRESLHYWLALQRLPDVGVATANKLLDLFHNPQAIFTKTNFAVLQRQLKPTSIAAIEQYLTQGPASYLGREVAADINWLEQSNAQIITKYCPTYPEQLKQIAGAPFLLLALGNIELLNRPQLAMVGSRNPTISGRENAFAFAKDLSQLGFVITSGLALGIDADSHRGALSGSGETVAVLGTSLDQIYPAKNKKLAESIATSGVIITEFPLRTSPQKQNFPKRNRLISGLSVGVLVIEAALKSGSLITAQYALEQNREVFAVPGSIHNPLAKGCHALIRQGAKLVESAEHILEELQWVALSARSSDPNYASEFSPSLKEEHQLDADEKHLLKCFGDETTSINQLISRSGLDAATVSSALLILELKGIIINDRGNFQRIKQRETLIECA